MRPRYLKRLSDTISDNSIRIVLPAMRRPVAGSLLTLLTVLALSHAARADDGPTTYLIVDGSGSMWGRIEPDRRAKIDIVREILKPIVVGAAAGKIGLASFGHRRRADCSDVEIIAPAGTDRELVAAPLDKLNPRGKGPIAEALRQTAKAIGTARPASILVVTDGADNCLQDACEAATEIARSTPGVPVHLVSLAVDQSEAPRLSCVAGTTGGKYFEVRDAQGIAPAIEEAAKLAMMSPGQKPPPTAAPQAAAPIAGATLRLTASLAANTAPLQRPIHWRMTKDDGGTPVRDEIAPNLSLALDPGAYDIEAALGSIRARQSVAVERRAEPLAVNIPLNAAHLNLLVTSNKVSDQAGTTLITVAAPGDNAAAEPAWMMRGGSGDVVLPPGTYQVTASDGLVQQRQQVSLSAGNDTDLRFALGSGHLELTASLREDGDPMEAASFIVSEDDPDSPDGRREIGRSNATVAEFTLPAGTYYVAARAGEGETRQRVAVGAGDSLKRTLVVPVARLKISSLVAGQPAADGMGLNYRITSLDEEPREVARSVMPDLDLMLKAGRYRISANLGTLNVKAVQEVVLEAGKPAEVSLNLEAAEVSLKPPPGMGAMAGETFWEIKDGAGKAVWHTSIAEPKAVLAPGRYTVKLETRDKRLEAAFDVRSGERRAVQLGAN